MTKLADLIGKTYKSGARGPEQYDCWGLVMEVASRNGQELPDYEVDAYDKNAVMVLTRIEKNLKKWRRWPDGQEPRPGLIVAFQLNKPGEITHAGFMVGNKTFIHCIQKKGVVIEPTERYQNLIEGYYEFRQD